ncbi:MAG: Lon-like protease [Archaeoglobi archaeon]|nr:hypothetical protein [Candidatus Mnemosynella bozhongmuii]MDI3502702.1 Lon-like protease [Archaeoglobi archaeon]MDK2781023.1 Lon-like protease [Archaeoglobi archaeon]
MRKEIISYLSIFLLGVLTGAVFFHPLSESSPGILEGREAEANIVAVSSLEDVGVMGKVRVQILPGEGRVLISTNPFVEPDTQYSAETAVKVASKITGVDFSDYDIIFDFRINGTVLGGPSAGAAMTVALIAAVENSSVREDAVITGTIEEDGKIGEVGGILEKAQAAAQSGMKLFLLPEGQSQIKYYEKIVKERRVGEITFYEIHYVPSYLNLSEYMSSYGLQVVEVSDIREALYYLLEKSG